MAAAWVWVFFAGVAWFALGAFISVETMSGPVEFVGLGVTTTYTRVDCAPPPLLSSATNRSAFLQDLLPLLAALPAAVATTPLGFASLQSGGASVRGLCLGATLEKECVACLAVAAENLTGCFLGASRRGGVWIGDGCFLAYADANSSSAREDAFRDVVLAGQDPGEGPNCFDPPMLVALAQSLDVKAKLVGAQVDTDAAALVRNATRKKKTTVRVYPEVARGTTTVRVLAQCARDRAARCARCLGDAARRVPPCSWGLDGAHERVADVLGYNCFLRVKTSVPLQLVTSKTKPNKPLAMAFFVLALLSTVAAGIAAASGYLPAVNAAAN
ncbi:uncharacterized protein [Lolium perenne]|uniref:uncharacterized protein isoform X2 n=1 Tax=Lolium perenne TaxID=4522 RepID=UPI0021F62819|nr:uncharacterized protein LOC127324011 isoform X2 [Lolium perenne]